MVANDVPGNELLPSLSKKAKAETAAAVDRGPSLAISFTVRIGHVGDDNSTPFTAESAMSHKELVLRPARLSSKTKFWSSASTAGDALPKSCGIPKFGFVVAGGLKNAVQMQQPLPLLFFKNPSIVPGGFEQYLRYLPGLPLNVQPWTETYEPLFLQCSYLENE